MAQVTFVAEADTTNTGGGVTTTVITKPTGVQDGDLLLAFFAFSTFTWSLTTLAGWTLLDSNNASPGSTYLYWKLASSEGTNYTWTHANLGGSDQLCASIVAFRNVHQTTPIEVNSKAVNTVASTTATGATVTPTTSPQSQLVAFISAMSVNQATSLSAEAVANNNPTWAEAVDISATGGTAPNNTSTLAIAYAGRDFATATGAFTATIANSAKSTVYLLSIKPAGFTWAPNPFSGTVSLPAEVAGMGLAAPLLSAANSIPAGTAATAASKWSNTSKSSTTWTNTQKS